ncbi:hypothetical protein [Cohnella sp. GCM10027633]|uniref:hypothetical protein n=1 Tax=unclassified Cohnella TaxID=2636738 RepID=UPI0036335280
MPLTPKTNKQSGKTTPTGKKGASTTTSGNPLAMHQALGNQGMLAMLDAESEDKGNPQHKGAKAMSKPDPKAGTAKRMESAKKISAKNREATLAEKRGKFTPGMHGYKKKEQARLSEAYGIEVTGDSHESEHTIGFEPLNQTSGNKRGENATARRLENIAPAYQEVKQLHRDHIGTGTQNDADASGFNSEGYRSAQRSLVEDGDVSSAVQLNQLGYAFDDNKSKLTTTDEGLAANDSFDTMVSNMDSVTYASGEDETTVGVDAKQKAEMYLSRRAMITGKFPTVEEENEARKKFGIDVLPVETKMEE